MKRPNPTFLQKAPKIQSSRRKRTLSIVLIALGVTLVIMFFRKVSYDGQTYAQLFPDLVGAAQRETTTYEEYRRPVHTTTESTTESTTEETTTFLAPSFVATSESTSETPSTVTQNNSPDPVLENPDYTFKKATWHQTATYQKRAVLLDNLREKVKAVDEEQTYMRVCFQFISLEHGDGIGYKNLEPVLPSGAYAIPIELVWYDQYAQGKQDLAGTSTYQRSSKGAYSASYIGHTFKYGKQFFHRNALNYAITKNDSIALNFIIDSMEGMDKIIPEINKISGYVSYDSKTLYQDYRSRRYKAPARTSCFDMGEYLRYLYNGYINTPDVYQRIINDMYYNESVSPLKGAFVQDTPILHVMGRNTDMGAYMECAIIDCEEPIAVVVYVEASSEEHATNIMQQIGRYTAEFVTSCYKT
ncbi:MAG: serine hydrolase [Clostridiales bacterium]|nr:serine hydrolase [Clostridiales bacterium]